MEFGRNPTPGYLGPDRERTRGVQSEGEALVECLDRGSRHVEETGPGLEEHGEGSNGEYRVRSPTNSERLNRALVELGLSAFKVHLLIWKWRGAPARGTLPFFTIRSLEKFCHLTRPTVRVALDELTSKGWIVRKEYNVHHKNALYSLVAVRQIPRPTKEHGGVEAHDVKKHRE